MKTYLSILLLLFASTVSAQFLNIRAGLQMVDENLTHMESDQFGAGSVLSSDFRMGGENLHFRVGGSIQRFRVNEEREFSKSLYGSLGIQTNNWRVYASVDGGISVFDINTEYWVGVTAGTNIPMVDNIFLNIEAAWKGHLTSPLPEITDNQLYLPTIQVGIAWKLFNMSEKIIMPGSPHHSFYD